MEKIYKKISSSLSLWCI